MVVPDNPQVRWFPIYARFAPDGSWLVVNMCSFYNPLYCRLVRWEPKGESQALEDGTPSTGKWSLIAGQQPDKSYIWPSVSWDGKKLAYVVANCPAKAPQPAVPRPTGDPVEPPHPHNKLDCAFHNGQPAKSDSTSDLRLGQQIAPIYSAARPAWRPDDQAILYWRTVSAVTLASGLTSGLRDVYEFDFGTLAETQKFDLFATRIMWDGESHGPFYSPDSKSFALCGRGSNLAERLGLFPSVQCVKVNSQNPKDFEGINARSRAATFISIFDDWNGTHWVGTGEQVRLVDKVSFEIQEQLFDTRLPTGFRSNFSPTHVAVSKTKDAVFINATLFGAQLPNRKWEYWFSDGRGMPPSPNLAFLSSDTKALQPVYWPNVDALK